MAARKKTTRKSPRKRAARAATGSSGSEAAATETALAEIRERLTRIETWMEGQAPARDPEAASPGLHAALGRIETLAQALAASREAAPPASAPAPEPPLDRQMLWAVTAVVIAVLGAVVALGIAGTLGGDAVAIVVVGVGLYAALQARPLLALFGKRREPPAF